MDNFNTFGLPSALVESLSKSNFIVPTPIQYQAIPVALNGRDVIGTAQTGTGKTAAFAIPLIAHLLANEGDSALIMTPTRELASQVKDMLVKILYNNISVALIVGGAPIMQQIYQLNKKKPRIVVGTPGRINDHIKRKTLSLKNTTFLVLDETDRMLDMGFSEAIDMILSCLPEKRQTLLFSATLPRNIMQLAGKYLENPEYVAVESTKENLNANIQQDVVYLAEIEKYDNLLGQLDERVGSIIVFVKTKRAADKIAHQLQLLNHEVAAIHGDLRQRQRDKVIKDFRNKKNRILIATDVAARGLDIPHIEHVINYDLPHAAEDYVHRIGRTGRAGASGFALNLVSPQDKKKWSAIMKFLDPNYKYEKTEDTRRPKPRFGHRSGGGRTSGDFGGSARREDARGNFRSDARGDFRGSSRGESNADSRGYRGFNKPSSTQRNGSEGHSPRNHGPKSSGRPSFGGAPRPKKTGWV